MRVRTVRYGVGIRAVGDPDRAGAALVGRVAGVRRRVHRVRRWLRRNQAFWPPVRWCVRAGSRILTGVILLEAMYVTTHPFRF